MRKRFIPSLLLIPIALALYVMPVEYLSQWRLGLYDIYLQAADSVGGRGELRDRDEVLELRERLLQKDAEIALLRKKFAEVTELSECLPKISFVMAETIFRDEDPLGDSISIDRGLDDGVRVGDGVTQGQSLAGEVDITGRKSSRVRLLSNPACVVAAVCITSRGKLEPAREMCTVVGRGRGRVQVIFYSNSVMAQRNSLVVTSGLMGKLPSGLVVGELSENPSQGVEANTMTSRIKVSADLPNMEGVAVLGRANQPGVDPVKRDVRK